MLSSAQYFCRMPGPRGAAVPRAVPPGRLRDGRAPFLRAAAAAAPRIVPLLGRFGPRFARQG